MDKYILQRKYTDGKQAQKKLLNIINKTTMRSKTTMTYHYIKMTNF